MSVVAVQRDRVALFTSPPLTRRDLLSQVEQLLGRGLDNSRCSGMNGLTYLGHPERRVVQPLCLTQTPLRRISISYRRLVDDAFNPHISRAARSTKSDGCWASSLSYWETQAPDLEIPRPLSHESNEIVTVQPCSITALSVGN
jgi:hypothetical protein